MSRHKVIIVKMPQDCSIEEWKQGLIYSQAYMHTLTASHGDMLSAMEDGNSDSFVKMVFPERQPDVIDMLRGYGYSYSVVDIYEVTANV